MSNSVYVGNLSFEMTEKDLADVFSSIGPVASAKIISDRLSGRSRGFGFVEFESVSDVKKALDLNGKEIKGRSLLVSEAREKASSGGQGRY